MWFIILRMVGGQDTNIAAAAGVGGAIERFITNPVHTSMATEKCQHHSIPIFGQQPFFRSPSSVSSKLQQRWVDFPFPDSSLHLSTPCISWCSQYLGMFRVSAATQSPVIRGNTNTPTHEDVFLHKKIFVHIWKHTLTILCPDMEFVQKITPPDFQAKNFTPSISPNFNSVQFPFP